LSSVHRLIFCFLCLATFAGYSSAQSGRAKATPTPPPRTITGPSVLTGPQPTPSPRISPTPQSKDDDVITVESSLVPIPVSVLDERGRAVRDLKLADFELRIDGKPARVDELSRSETPIRLAMLFDNSSSVLIARDFEKEAAIKFFRRVIRPDLDMAALFSVATFTRLEQALTRDVSQLTRAIEAFPLPEGATALLDGIIDAANYLKSVEGRRVIVIVSDGDDTSSDLKTSLEDVVRALQISNCQVYVVKTTDFENFKRTGVRGGNANLRQLAAERRMQEIALQTGGAVYSPIDESEMNEAFKQISADLSQQYILSYYPDDPTERRGEFRSISVAVRGKPNVAVRTRKGYYVPRK
jgi:Ca-activated chloride channel homolog